MALETHSYDTAEFLDTEEGIAAYLAEVFASRDPAFIADGIGVVARARGMTQFAKDAGLSRENLYRALSLKGNPELATLVQVLATLGFRLTIAPIEHAPA